MKITQEQLETIAPNLPLESTELNKLLSKYKVNTINRISAFFALCGYNSIDYHNPVENLSYSLNGLKRCFRDIFIDDASAKPYSRNPVRIANKIYANKFGNGDEASGDGWKYRGRGFLFLKGKSNYAEFAKSIILDLDETIAYCETNEGLIESALYIWKRDNLNKLCDNDDIVGIIKAIYGNINGLTEIKERYENAKKYLNN